ncbi:putative opsin protein [Podospora didyma]|uniref:Opsin protein n=1 Tax=Podospora didyma TaxID=330526 RepID=A0AAE0U020_9PEZI|nr:putative opsin protein [Podospora didyma]
MIHADQIEAMTRLGRPTATTTATPGPIPTIIVPLPDQYQQIGAVGHRTLWVLFALMVLSSAVFALLSWNVPISRRVYHVVTTLTTIVASISYFAIASGHASKFNCTTVYDHHGSFPDTHHEVCRQVFWARYVDWALTTPLLILNLSLLAGLDGAHTLMAIAADLIMVLTGLFAAFGAEGTAQHWGWYTLSCLSYLFVIWHIGVNGSRMVQAKGSSVSKLFASLATFSLLLWTAYPIVWGIAEGAHKTSVDTEILIYAVLDVLTKPILGLWLLFSHRSLAETNIELGGWWSHGFASQGRIRIGDEE